MRYAQFYPRLVMMYAYGRAPVADPCPHMDTAATAAGEWIESVGGGEMGVEPGLVSGSGMSSFGPDAVSNTSMLDGARRGAAASTR